MNQHELDVMAGQFGASEDFRAAIADQNDRYDQLATITDSGFAALARDGLQEELNASLGEMAEGPYEQLGHASLQASHDVTAAEEVIVEIEESIRNEAEHAAIIAPLAAERIRQRAATRLETDQELNTARTLRDEAQGLLAATNDLLERHGAAWAVPRLLGDRALEAAAARATAEAEVTPEPPKPESKPAAWEANFKTAVTETLNRLAEQDLVRLDPGTDELAPVTNTDIHHRSQSRTLGTKTAFERLVSAGIIATYNEHNTEPITVQTLVAMALLNSNKPILGGNSTSKQKRGLDIIEEAVREHLAKIRERAAGAGDAE